MSILDYRGPQRRAENARAGTLFGIALAAFLAYWVVTPAVYQVVTGHKLLSTSQPTTQSVVEIPPHDLVALSIASPVVALVTLIAGSLLCFRKPFEQAGLTSRLLLNRGWWQGLLAGIAVLPAMFAVLWLTQKFWDAIHYSHPNEHDLLRVLGAEPNATFRVAIIVSAIVLAPLFEEFFFRGMIQRACRMHMHRWLAIVLASLAFTLVHGALWLAPPIFFLSLCLGYAYDRTRNLWVSILIHASFNAASLTMFLFSR
jgi:membrane protease YdiL (CAAX protease family)